ncbi:MAG TPA: o-succinylbenzoate--CoA ligase, partial [Gemmatimonadaceae bacterium]
GVQPGDRVALLLPNGLAFATLLHAAPRAGAVLVPLNLRLTVAEQTWQVVHSGARWLAHDSRTHDSANALAAAVPGLVLLDANDTSLIRPVDPAHSSPDAPKLEAASLGAASLDAYELNASTPDAASHDAPSPSAPYLVIYTSGTTGRPKGAVLTHGNLWWSATGSALHLGLRDDDVWLACLPLFHVGGLSILVRAACYGIAAVVHERFDAAAVNAAIDEERVSLVSVVPTMLQRMIDARGDAPYPPTLRCVLLGGGPAPRPLLEACARLCVPVAQTYGLTETASQLATLPPAEALRRLGSAGTPLYPSELRIVDAHGRTVPVGAPGEILVRGPTVMSGYHSDPGASARALAGGWLHTGDEGRVDADGYLYVLGRRDDMIVTGGENVYPAEVESVLLSHHAVAEVAVIGVPDDAWGQRVVAVVRLNTAANAIDADALRAHCRAQLAGYKVPREVRFTAEPLPRTASGKLRRRALRAER